MRSFTGLRAWGVVGDFQPAVSEKRETPVRPVTPMALEAQECGGSTNPRGLTTAPPVADLIYIGKSAAVVYDYLG